MARKKLAIQPAKVSVPPKSTWEPILWMFGGLLMVIFAVLVGSTNVRWYIPNEGAIPRFDALALFIPGILLLFFGFKSTSNYSTSQDISSRQAGIGLILCLAVGAIIRLYHMDIPFGGWWADQMNPLYDAWGSYTSHKIHLLDGWGWRPCFATCIEVLVMKFLPDLSGPATMKVSATFIDLFSLLTFYLLGKEVGGRRTGIIMLAMGVISRELIDKVFLAPDICTYSFAVSLSLLVFFRLIHKPTHWRFIQWGAFTALGLYTYNGYRAWLPFAILGVSIWVLSHAEERKLSIGCYGLALWGSTLWILWYLRVGHLIIGDSFLGSDHSNWFYWILAGLSLISIICIIRQFKVNSTSRLLVGLGLGLIFAALVCYPMITDPNFSQRSNQVLNLNPFGDPAGFLKFCLNTAKELVNMFFVEGNDLPWVGPNFQTLFSLHAIVIIFIGIAFLIAKPTKEKIWIVLSIIPVIVPYIMVEAPHTGRLMGVVPPLYLLGALGLDQFWGIFSKKAGTWGLRILGILFLTVFWTWSAWANIQSVWAWSNFPKSVIANVCKAAESEVGHGRVYVGSFSVDYDNIQAMQVLINGKDIYGLTSSNPIFVLPGEKNPDVIVLCPNDDKKDTDRLKKEFPNAQWSEDFVNRSPDKGYFYLWKVLIPGNDITTDNKKILFIETGNPEGWSRKFYGSDFGIGRGVIYGEDVVTDIHSPFPYKREDWMGNLPYSVRLEKELKIDNPGPYVFSTQSNGCIQLNLENGKEYKVFNRATYGNDEMDSKTVNLEKGTYQVELCCVSQTGGVREVTVQSPDGSKIEW